MTDSMEQHFNDEDERVSTGIEGLDDVLNGGFPQGHFFLIEGEPGTGKTTLGLQFLMQGARKGEKSLYVTLSESKREIEKVARCSRNRHWCKRAICGSPTRPGHRCSPQLCNLYTGSESAS